MRAQVQALLSTLVGDSVRLHYMDADGTDWLDEDVLGRVSYNKVTGLYYLNGSEILVNAVGKITKVCTGQCLWQHKHYQEPNTGVYPKDGGWSVQSHEGSPSILFTRSKGAATRFSSFINGTRNTR